MGNIIYEFIGILSIVTLDDTIGLSASNIFIYVLLLMLLLLLLNSCIDTMFHVSKLPLLSLLLLSLILSLVLLLVLSNAILPLRKLGFLFTIDF